MKMAFLPDFTQFFEDLIDSGDSDDGEFTGFGPEDVDEARGRLESLESAQEGPIFNENFVEGDRPTQPTPFTGVPGLNPATCSSFPSAEDASELDYLNLFLKEEDYESMATETNRYAEQYFDKNKDELKPNSRFHKWVPTNSSEMKILIAVILAMGLLLLPTSEYWSTNPVIETTFIRSLMSRYRLNFFHWGGGTN